ncbi:MAG TPA: DJ-1/PfpI family protein [Candidatus Binatia bacterium]
MRRLGIALVFLVVALAASVWAWFPGARPSAAASRPETAEEHERLVEALRPPKAPRPLIAVLLHNDGTETTDFMVPYGVLRASGAADVVAVGLRDAPATLMPALRVRPQSSVAAFDASHPGGADYVIVPAMHRSDDPEVLAWIRGQFERGATVVGVCDGAWVLAHAGLLDGREATGHWYSARGLRTTFPHVRWTRDRRYVVDRRVVTTTGVSASIPVSLTLVEAIAGRPRAEALAASMGIDRWDAGHASAAFALDRASVVTAARNLLAPWAWDTVALALGDGVDDVGLALTADAYARTFRTSVRAVSDGAPEVTTRHGLTVLADATAPPADGAALVPLAAPGGAHRSALDAALDGVERRYGAPTAAFVALQLEYPR